MDDTSHDWKDEAARTAYFESLGFIVLRFTNREVAFEHDGVVATIEGTVDTLRNSPITGPGVPWLGRG